MLPCILDLGTNSAMSSWGPYGGKPNRHGRKSNGWRRGGKGTGDGSPWVLPEEALLELSGEEPPSRGASSSAPPPTEQIDFTTVKADEGDGPTFEPASALPAIGNSERAAFLQSLKDWLRSNLTVMELESVQT